MVVEALRAVASVLLASAGSVEVEETHIHIHIYSFGKVDTLATLWACIHFFQGTAHEQ